MVTMSGEMVTMSGEMVTMSGKNGYQDERENGYVVTLQSSYGCWDGPYPLPGLRTILRAALAT